MGGGSDGGVVIVPIGLIIVCAKLLCRMMCTASSDDERRRRAVPAGKKGIQCPRCRTKLLVSSPHGVAVCPKCQTRMRHGTPPTKPAMQQSLLGQQQQQQSYDAVQAAHIELVEAANARAEKRAMVQMSAAFNPQAGAPKPDMMQTMQTPTQTFQDNNMSADMDRGVAVKDDELTMALKAARLTQYEDALRELGCVAPADLNEVDEEDLTKIGMKKIEVKRLMRFASP